MYPDERVAEFIRENFVPVKIHIKENHAGFERFGVQWTPTIVIADGDGKEHYRFEGYLPVEEFLPQLELGLGRLAFNKGDWAKAERLFREVAEKYPKSDAAPEALYFAGAAKYKASGDPGALRETAGAFRSRYADTAWAKKASVWAA